MRIWTPVSRMATLDDEGEQCTIEEVEAMRDQVLAGARSMTVEVEGGEQVTGNVKAILIKSRLAVLELADGTVEEIGLFRNSTRH